MIGLLDVESVDLSRLGPSKSVEVLAKLLWAECHRLAIPVSSVNISFNINTPDGGIDATVVSDLRGSNSELITAGVNSYQVKSGVLSVATPSAAKELLETKAGSLKLGVKNCFDQGGTFFAILFGSDPTDKQNPTSYLKEFLASHHPEFAGANIRVIQQNQLIGLLEPFPSIRRRILGRSSIGSTFDSWSEREGMTVPLELGPAQNNFIETVRSLVREKSKKPIRVIGDAGCGKTRLTLESLRDSDLAPLVIYFDEAENVTPSLIDELAAHDSIVEAILVVDECSHDMFIHIQDRLYSARGRVQVIALCNETENESPKATYLELSYLTFEQIEAILRKYIPGNFPIGGYVELCSGSPRAAHTFGFEIKDDPQKVYDSPSWQTYINGRLRRIPKNQRSELVRVLDWLSLFTKVGILSPHESDFEFFAAIVNQSAGLSTDIIREHIDTLKRCKLVQGRSSVYITPEIVRLFLWRGWWSLHGAANGKILLEKLSERDSIQKIKYERLLGSFTRTLGHTRKSIEASAVARQLLTDETFFSDDFIKSSVGSNLFLNLAGGSLQNALSLLEKKIKTWSDTEISALHDSKYNIVEFLIHAANRKRLFERSCQILVRLAINENNSFANNSRGVFQDLFRSTHGFWSLTSAPPVLRLKVLGELLSNSDDAIARLALQACSAVLDIATPHVFPQHFSNLENEREQWIPNSNDEILEYLKSVWALTESQLSRFPELAADSLVKGYAGFMQVESLEKFSTDEIVNLYKKGSLSREKILPQVSHQLRFKSELTKPVRRKLERFALKLEGSTLQDRLFRYVAIPQFEDYHEGNGTLKIKGLAAELFNAPSILGEVMNWLATDKAQYSPLLGAELGQLDKHESLMTIILDAVKGFTTIENAGFWSGYLSATALRQQTRWKRIIHELSRHTHLKRFIPEFIWRGKVDIEMCNLVSELLKEGSIHGRELSIFFYGGVIKDVPESFVKDWIEHLLKSPNSRDYEVALDLLGSYYPKEQPLPEEITYRVLVGAEAHPLDSSSEVMNEYHWCNLAERYVQLPEARIQMFASRLIDYLESDSLRYHRRDPYSYALLLAAKRDSDLVWKNLSNRLESCIETGGGWNLTYWIREVGVAPSTRETVPGLKFLPKQEVLAWIAIDPTRRALPIADGIPVRFVGAVDTEFLSEFLGLFGDQEEVRRQLLRNLHSDGWMGKASYHYAVKLKGIEQFRLSQTNQYVILWCEEAQEMLEGIINRAKLEEEDEPR